MGLGWFFWVSDHLLCKGITALEKPKRRRRHGEDEVLQTG